MKKTVLFSLAAGLLLTASSCKKGENDPFLSLKSRDSRITGEWVLKSSEETYIAKQTYGGVTETETEITSFNGTVMTEKEISGGDTDIETYSYAMTIGINKDGTYKTITVDDGETDTETGYWWWINNANKKTRIALDDDAYSFEIDRLKSKEMVWVFTYENSYSSAGYSSTITSSGTMTFEKK